MSKQTFFSALVNPNRQSGTHEFLGMNMLATEDMGEASEFLSRFSLSSEPLYARIDGREIQEDNLSALVARDTEAGSARLVRSISNTYSIVQPVELATAVDRLTGNWPLAAVAFSNNRYGVTDSVYVALRMPEYVPARLPETHRHSPFLVIRDDFGGGGISVQMVDIRLVCKNGMVSSKTLDGHSLSHTNNARLMLDLTVALESNGIALRKSIDSFWATAVATQADTQARKAFWEEVFPAPKSSKLVDLVDRIAEDNPELSGLALNSSESAFLRRDSRVASQLAVAGRAIANRERLEVSYQNFIQDYPELADTGYALMNAVTDYTSNGQHKGRYSASQLGGELFRTQTRAMTAMEMLGAFNN